MEAERKEKLIALFSQAVNTDALNEFDALAVLEICLAACKREKNAAMEEMLKVRVLNGGDWVS